MHEILGDGVEMPGFDDGMANIAEPIGVMAGSFVNEVMDARADEARGAGNQGNGYRERRPATGAGAINLGIPKLRAGSRSPEGLVERYLPTRGPRGGRRRVRDGGQRRARREGVDVH